MSSILGNMIAFAFVLLLVIYAVRSMIKRNKSGGCGCGCSDCTGKSSCAVSQMNRTAPQVPDPSGAPAPPAQQVSDPSGVPDTAGSPVTPPVSHL